MAHHTSFRYSSDTLLWWTWRNSAVPISLPTSQGTMRCLCYLWKIALALANCARQCYILSEPISSRHSPLTPPCWQPAWMTPLASLSIYLQGGQGWYSGHLWIGRSTWEKSAVNDWRLNVAWPCTVCKGWGYLAETAQPACCLLWGWQEYGNCWGPPHPPKWGS